MEEKIRGLLKAKAGTGKAVKIGETWYELDSDKVKNFVAGIQKPYPEVEIEVVKKGYKKVITFLKPIIAETAKDTVTTGSTTKPEYSPRNTSQPVTESKQYSKQADDEKWARKDAQIRRGNALNAAAAVQQFGDDVPAEVIVEKTRIIAQGLLEWLEEGIS